MAKKEKVWEIEVTRTIHQRAAIRVTADSKGAALFEGTKKIPEAQWMQTSERTEIGKVEALVSGESGASAAAATGTDGQ